MKREHEKHSTRFEFVAFLVFRVSKDAPHGLKVAEFSGHNRLKLKEEAETYQYLQRREPGVTYLIRERNFA